MRVLHLPVNMASQLSTSVRALRAIGVEARGLSPSRHLTSEIGLETFPSPSKKNLVQALAAYLVRIHRLVPALLWADVIHWHYHWGLFNALDLKLAHHMQKKRVVEFHGSDIRIPEIEAADNPYFARIIDKHEYCLEESRARSVDRQSHFGSAGATCVIPYEGLRSYLQPALFSDVRLIRHRLVLDTLTPVYPDPLTTDPMVLHVSTAPILKGTAAVESAIQSLIGQITFRYQAALNQPHAHVQELMRRCDVFIDQMILGSHGVAAVEAMAYGKPVICYIKPSLVDRYPPELPIIKATSDNLSIVLSEVLKNGKWRHELGRRGRAYVERYHDARVLAHQLKALYAGL